MAKIAELVRQNPWWNHGANFAQYDPHLSKAKPLFFRRKEPHVETGNIYILRGPRQVGKTTYLKETAKRLIEKGVSPRHILYLSLDFFTSRRELRNAANFFLDSTRDADAVYILLDEITALEDWNLELKYLADQGITSKSVVIATGSSAAKLKEKGELLPGRGLEGNEYYMKPLSFREFVRQSIPIISGYISTGELREALVNLKTSIDECSIDLDSEIKEVKGKILRMMPCKKELQYLFGLYLISGGSPGVINHYLINKYEKHKEMIEPAIAEIFIRDVLGDLARLQKQENLAREILKAVLDRYGSRYSFTGLSKAIERTHVTTIDYLEFLEDSFILAVFYAYDFSKKDAKLKGDKKAYFSDPFIYHAIKSYLSGRAVWEVITETSWSEEIQSKLVEGLVMQHLLMHKEMPYLKKGNTFLWLYYDKSGKEIDAILKADKKYWGIEVKYQAQADARDVQQIAPVKHYLLLSKDDVEIGDSVSVVPVDVFLSLLEISERNV